MKRMEAGRHTSQGLQRGSEIEDLFKLKIIQGHVQNTLKCGGKTRTVLNLLKGLKCFEGMGSE